MKILEDPHLDTMHLSFRELTFFLFYARLVRPEWHLDTHK